MMGGREERKKEEEGARGWVLEGSSEPAEPPAADASSFLSLPADERSWGLRTR